MKQKIKDLIAQMTLEEKASLCSGKNFWYTKSIERLGIPSMMLTDGPHGLRKQKGTGDHLGIQGSVPATCFPSAAGLASSWNRDLVHRVGVALGEECQTENVGVLLGPGVNIKRTPLCGRNFEYFSEDPYQAGEMATAHILGVQSQGVGTSLKHFAANNQETRRMGVNVIADERTLREIYLPAFEKAVKEAKPWTVMCAYNQINGKFACQNPWLLTDVLRDEWCFDGFVVSDWGAVDQRIPSLKAGLELEMPTIDYATDAEIVDAVRSGKLEEAVLDEGVGRYLHILFKVMENRKEDAQYDKDAHHQLAREVAGETIVLLKNDDNILPFDKNKTLAVIGEFAQRIKYQGGGSSHVKPTKLDVLTDELTRITGQPVSFSKGYHADDDTIDDAMISEAVELAKEADNVLVVVGLPDRIDSEGFDRETLDIPLNQLSLLEAVLKACPHAVVALVNGSSVVMPWLKNAKVVLTAYMAGQAAAGALADVVFGVCNPSGKLAETWPEKLSHNPSELNFPGDDTVEYREGIFVGYRYYEKKGILPLFPFGHGLSYTTFVYSDMELNKTSITDEETVTVTAKITNTGFVSGKEIAQLYVKDVACCVPRPIKELKGFEKVIVAPGETQKVSFTLDRRAFAYWDTMRHDWTVESGAFEILVGGSSACTPLKAILEVTSCNPPKTLFTRYSTLADIMTTEVGRQFLGQMTTMMPMADDNQANGNDSPMGVSMEKMMAGMTLKAMAGFSGGKLSLQMVDGMIALMNSETK